MKTMINIDVNSKSLDNLQSFSLTLQIPQITNLQSSRLILVNLIQSRHPTKILTIIEMIDQECIQLIICHREVQSQSII